MASAPAGLPLDGLALEPHGDRRRRQLVRVAAHIIEDEGVDSLRMPRVAEIAGCARSLVYRYFPRREDLFFAVISEWYERLEERMTPETQAAKMRALGEPATALPLRYRWLHPSGCQHRVDTASCRMDWLIRERSFLDQQQTAEDAQRLAL